MQDTLNLWGKVVLKSVPPINPAANMPVFIHEEQGKPSQMPEEVVEPLA
jgi:hypothetical protein